MKTRVIVAECSYDFWVDIVAKLACEAGWEPVYWVSAPEMRESVMRAFPHAVFHSNFDAMRGIPPPEFSRLPRAVLDQPTLEHFAWHESIVLRMMDRMDPGDAFGYAERVRLYDTLIKYWSGVLDQLRPDLVLFSMVPHIVYDYVFYQLCRARGIKTVLLEPIYLEGLLYPMERFEDGSPAIRELYDRLRRCESGAPVQLSPANERHLARIAGTYSEAMPFYLKEKIDDVRRWRESRFVAPLQAVLRKVATLRHYPRYCVSAGIRLRQALAAKPPRNYLKQHGRPIEHSWMTAREHRLYRRGAKRKKRELADYYERLSRPPDLEQPYVFVALHYQPERTTSPGGGAFADQSRMVDLVAKTVPEGWQVYVKEHPAQLAPFWKGELARTRQFYDDLAAIPNVRLLPLSFSPFPLVDRARAVVTVSGTVGWEALIRGTPVLTFGTCWYSNCEGVFYTPSLEACRDAFARISAGYKPDFAKVRLFVHVLERVCFRGYIDQDNQKVAGVSHADNIVAVATALRDFTETRS